MWALTRVLQHRTALSTLVESQAIGTASTFSYPPLHIVLSNGGFHALRGMNKMTLRRHLFNNQPSFSFESCPLLDHHVLFPVPRVRV